MIVCLQSKQLNIFKLHKVFIYLIYLSFSVRTVLYIKQHSLKFPFSSFLYYFLLFAEKHGSRHLPQKAGQEVQEEDVVF